jgi:hypothetical protein
MRDVWLLFAERRQMRLRYVDELAATLAPLVELRDVETRFGTDQLALRAFLADVRMLLDEMLRRGQDLVDADALDDLRAAWRFMERERLFDDVLRQILSPAAGEQLATVGLVGAPRELKTNGFRRAYEALLRTMGRWSWPDVKPVLKWANVILGSLAKTMTSIDPLKEFKESWEAAAEQAYE